MTGCGFVGLSKAGLVNCMHQQLVSLATPSRKVEGLVSCLQWCSTNAISRNRQAEGGAVKETLFCINIIM